MFIFSLFVWGAWNAACEEEKTEITDSEANKRINPEAILIHLPSHVHARRGVQLNAPTPSP